MPSTNRLRSLWQLLLLLFPSDAFRSTGRRLLCLWLFLKSRFRRLGWAGKSGKRRDPGGQDGRSSSGNLKGFGLEGPRDGYERAQIHCSKEPVMSHLGLHLEHGPLDLLNARNPPSRPVSTAYPESRNSSGDNQPYSISVQNASRSSIGFGLTTFSDQVNHDDNVNDHDHLAPSTRASSRASVRRPYRGMEDFVTGPTSGRAIARSRSRARSPALPFNQSRLSVNSVALQEKSPAHSGLNLAVPAGALPSPTTRIRRVQKVYPILSIKRYERNILLDKSESEFTVNAMDMSYPLDNVPAGWKALTHPEGALYFFHEQRRIYTDAYLCDHETLMEIEDFAELLNGMLIASKFELPPNVDLVLELEDNPKKDTEHYWCYYYANHDDRVLFWLQDYLVTDELQDLKGLNTPTHIRHGIEEHYWYSIHLCPFVYVYIMHEQECAVLMRHIHRLHWDMFPFNHEISQELFHELRSIVLHANIDQLTSTTSTITNNSDELAKMLSLVESIKDSESNQHIACVVGRLMHVFAHHRFIHYHGQKVARLCRDQSLFGQTHSHRSPLIKIIAPLLFNAPEVHLNSLEKIWIDNIITIIPWTQFMTKLQEDWQEYVLFATVLLNANISFMTINDVDPGSGPRTPAQIASFVSTIASIGSTLVGLLLIRQYRLKPKDTAQEAVNYLLSRRHPTLGLETLAIMYSLPYALLMWAMVTFVVAFAIECFSGKDFPSIYVSGVSWGLIGVLTIWCIYTAWEGGETSVREVVSAAWERFLTRMTKSAGTVFHWHGVLNRGLHPHASPEATP